MTATSIPAQDRVTATEEDLRILEVVLDEVLLSEGLAAYAGPTGGTLLPLQATSELLALAITTNPSEGLASGFILDERRAFHLDVGRGQVTISGKQKSFAPSLVQLKDDDVYVDSELLGEWLPVAFDIDLFSLRMRVRPREPLPLQTRLERERRIRLWRLRLPPADPGYPRLRTSYRFWEPPSVDQTLRLSFGEVSSASFATFATGDFLFMESEAFLSGSDEEPFETARLTLRRRDAAGTIGGWLSATEIAVGHVVHPSSPLLTTTSALLPGFLLTNLPLSRPEEFDRHTFRGNLPPGWDVELYHNDALVDYQPSRPDGQYAFDSVPVLFGMNFFRLVFYGPQGQRREEAHRFLLGESLTQPGRFEYRVTGNVENEATRRLSSLVAYGVNRHLTASAEAAVLPTLGGQRRYGKIGLRAFWSALFVYADAVQDDVGGNAWQGGLQTRLFGTNILVRHEQLSDGFTSEIYEASGDPILTRDRLRLDTAIPAWILPRIPVSLEVERRRLSSGTTQTTVQNRFSARYKGLSITNRALWTSVTGMPARIEAGLQLSRYIRGVGIRGELLYTVDPIRASTANVVIEKSLASGYRIFANVTRSFITTSHVYSIGIDKTTGSFGGGVSATSDARGNGSANVLLSAGLGRDPREGSWVPDAHARAPFGAASLRVYLDQEENGRFDAGDQLLPGVGFTVNGADRAARTNDKGLALIAELSPQQPADIAVDTRTLEDPQWVALLNGVRIIPRPGKAETIDVPIVATAEIEGTVSTMRNGTRHAVGGVAMELVDAFGNVVQRTATAYDGFYVLTRVRRGSYRVRIADAPEVQAVSQTPQHEKAVTITVQRPVLTGVDFVLLGPSAEPPSVPRTVIARQEPSSRPAPTAPEVRPAREAMPAMDADHIVQLGSFTVVANAFRRANAVRDLVPDARVVQIGEYWVIRTGRRSRSESLALERELAKRGIDALVLQAGPGGVREAPQAFIVQLGAFRSQSNASGLVREIARASGRWGLTITRRGQLYFVETSVFRSQEEAHAARESLRRLGFEALVKRPSG